MCIRDSSLFSPTQAQETNPQMVAFLERIDGANLEELEKELDEGIEGLKGFMGFFKARDEEPKTFSSEDERFSELFRIDTSNVNLATQQFKKIGFIQTFKENISKVKFEKIDDYYWSKISLSEGAKEWFVPKKIYYKNGSQETSGIENNKVSFFWDDAWGDFKVIDSIDIDYNIRYTKAYDSLLLTKNLKKLNYKEGIIKVKRFEKNHLYVTINDVYKDKYSLRALNKDGKPLSQNSYSFSPTSDDSAGDTMTKMLSILEEVQSRLKKNKFKDLEALKAYLTKKISKIEGAKDTDGVHHRKYFFNGNIDTVIFYFKTEEDIQTIPFTAVNNNSFKNILLNHTKEQLIFMDENAKEIFRIDERPLDRIGDRFFVEDQTYFYVNLNNKSLDKLEAVKVYESDNGLVFIQSKMENGFIVHDANLKQLSELEFSNIWSVSNEYAHALSHDKENYVIDSKGTIKKIEGVDEIGKQSEGLLMVKSKGKFGFIDASGAIVVSCIYNDAESFSEGLAVVRNDEGTYGFINMNGKMTLPMIYNRANSFENGIALVSKNESYLLIDKTGKVIVKTDSYGYSISGTGIKKTYQFGDKKYDAFGKLISQK